MKRTNRCDHFFRLSCCNLNSLLGRQGGCLTRDHDSITNVSLDQPVLVTIAGDAGADAALTQIEVAILANTTMVVFIRHRLAAIVTVDRVRG